MRYLCFVKMDENLAHPPQSIMDAMDKHVGEAIANGSFLDGGGLYGAKEAVEYRVRGGNVTVTDGPYAEAKEVIGGWAIVRFDSEERLGRRARRWPTCTSSTGRAGKARSRSAGSPSPTKRRPAPEPPLVRRVVLVSPCERDRDRPGLVQQVWRDESPGSSVR